MAALGGGLAGIGEIRHAVGAKVAKVLAQRAPGGDQAGLIEKRHGKGPDAPLGDAPGHPARRR